MNAFKQFSELSVWRNSVEWEFCTKLRKACSFHEYSYTWINFFQTIAVTQNQVACRLSEYFPNPNNFIPERWLREFHSQKIHPYLVLPFGHGPRTCIARRLAEQNLQLMIINVSKVFDNFRIRLTNLNTLAVIHIVTKWIFQAVRNYKLIWFGEELDCKSIQINKPDKKVLVKFEKRIF